jgi:hypothetical protein
MPETPRWPKLLAAHARAANHDLGIRAQGGPPGSTRPKSPEPAGANADHRPSGAARDQRFNANLRLTVAGTLLALTALVVGRVISIAVLVASCGGERVISVLPARTATEAEASPPLRVAVDTTSAQLPLAVSGASIAYGDVDQALTCAVERALEPTLRELARRHAQQLGLSVELLEARAASTHDGLIVRLAVRATLRENAGNVYLAQTHAHANASAAVPAERGAQVVLDCTDSIGRQLSGWLAGMDLR